MKRDQVSVLPNDSRGFFGHMIDLISSKDGKGWACRQVFSPFMMVICGVQGFRQEYLYNLALP